MNKKIIEFAIATLFILTHINLNAQYKILKYNSTVVPSSPYYLSNLYEASGSTKLGYNTSSPQAYFHVVGLTTNPIAPVFMASSPLGPYVKMIEGEMGIYQYNTATTSYNYFTSKSVFTNNLGIGAFTATSLPSVPLHLLGNGILNGNIGIGNFSAAPSVPLHLLGNGILNGNIGIGNFATAPTVPLHLKGSTFLMEPSNNTAMLLKNNSVGSVFEFWVKYDDSAPGGGGETDSELSIKALTINKDGILASKGLFSNVTTSFVQSNSINTETLVASTQLYSPLATLTNISSSELTASTRVQTSAFTLPTGAVLNYLLKTDAAGNASWADPSTMFPQLNLWQQNSNGTIYTAADAVGIGTTEMDDYMLAVNGMIGCKEVKVEVSNSIWGSWPDYVFEPSYQLPHLSEVETYININKHLPDVPSAKEVSEQGLAVGQMQATLLKKVEELTLYIIDQQKLIEQQGKELQELKKALKQ